MLNSFAKLDLEGSVLFGIHHLVSFPLCSMVPLFKPWQFFSIMYPCVWNCWKKRSAPDGNVVCKLPKWYFYKQHFKKNCLGLYNMGTNKNRKGGLNAASRSFFPLKDSVGVHFVLLCRWLQAWTSWSHTTAPVAHPSWGVPRNKSQKNTKGGLTLVCSELGTPAGLF